MSTASPPGVSARIFRAVQRVRVSSLPSCPDAELRPVLASLVRMSLIASLDKSGRCLADRTAVLEVLSRIELVNNLVALLSIDFHSLETDVRKEQQLRAKVGSSTADSVLISNLALGPALEFERSDATRRLRLVLSELLLIVGQIQLQNSRMEETLQNGGCSGSGAVTLRPSELFDHLVYFSEVCDVLCIAMAELPMLLSPTEVSEALLRLKYGPWIICHIVANQPDCFNDVVFHLLKNGDKQDDECSNKMRLKAIALLCEMNPAEIANVRNKCIEWCRLPSLALQLTIEIHKTNQDPDDLVSFMSGLLLGSDPQIRYWISFFIRGGQKRRNENLIVYRKCLIDKLTEFITAIKKSNGVLSQKYVVKASALLRLYAALRGMAGMKFSDEEIQLLFEIITCQPPPTPAGVKFVSIGLSMLIACNSIISVQSLETKTVEWIRWLVQEEEYFERKSGVSASFGEMLLLMAIHFHSHQLNAICDLVCQTLGMKITIRTNGMSRMKAIFTQEIFTEQVVASHAVKVPVTNNLSLKMSGFLPVHCIHQLLKSRAFSKHKVPIKDWIYRQICASSTPLHPVLPALIEVYVNSILTPASNRGIQDQTNEPIAEHEIKAVFKVPFFDLPSKCKNSSARLKQRLSATKQSRENISVGISRSTTRMETDEVPEYGLATQIVMLYYVMLHESVRLSHMRSIISSQRKVMRYSHDLLADVPIKFLLQTAERDQEQFGSIFPQLLKLCSTQYPHLCLVQDWLDQEAVSKDYVIECEIKNVSIPEVKEAFATLKTCPSKLTMTLQKMLSLPAPELWKFSDIFVSHVRDILEPSTTRQIRDLYKRLWFEINKVFPRQLWVKTVNALVHIDTGNFFGKKLISQDDLILDPLQVLRCERKVFLSGPILEIVMYILKACLAASRTQLSQHIADNPIIERAPHAHVQNDMEREELKNALVSTQESAAVQILLEAAVNIDGDDNEASMLTDLKEAQSLICSYLHEAFIAEPNLAKLVHFQGYPLELLPITVAGVPSMHICLDFAPELLSQPDLEKQIFAISLISHLSIQYALPKSYSIARLAVNTLSTLLSVLSMEERNILFPPVLPSLVRFCRSFPPLIEDITSFLLQYGKICVSESCLAGYASPKNFDMTPGTDFPITEARRVEINRIIDDLSDKQPLPGKVYATFVAIIQNALLEKNAF